MRISVLGAGAWGTAVSIALARRHEVTLWGRDAALIDAMRAARSNRRYLPGLDFPPALALAGEIAPALDGAELILVAVTTSGLRETLRLAARAAGTPVVWLCKGFESEQSKLPHEVCAEELGEDVRCAVLSGPSFADEVARGLPTALTLASAHAGFAHETAQALHGPALRVYSSDGAGGVEGGGAGKNVMAVAAGMSGGHTTG